MWRWVALVILVAVWVVVAVVVGATRASAQSLDAPDTFQVIETKKPRMCISQELKINMPCALLIQLLIKERGGDPFCTLHSCPTKV